MAANLHTETFRHDARDGKIILKWTLRCENVTCIELGRDLFSTSGVKLRVLLPLSYWLFNPLTNCHLSLR
jgi:hypothetical protein